jgi:AmmeMemoRadiSam system protein B
MGHPFCLTRKDFLTPLGRLEADQSLIDGIQSRCPYDLFGDERIHRSEHSIEFQCVFLRYLFPEPHPIKIVPILSGSFHEAIAKGVSPLEVEPIRQFVDALKKTLQTYPTAVCYMASADLAHLGLQFGDAEGMGEYGLRVLEAEDQEMLGWVERLDPEGFYRSIMKDQDRRRICGFPAIYTMLNVMEAGKGKLLKYGQAFTSETQSVVSFASLAFYR